MNDDVTVFDSHDVITNVCDTSKLIMAQMQRQSPESNNCSIFAIALCMVILLEQWSRNVFWIGGAKVNLKVTNLRNCYDSVQSTLSMHSMLLLGGSGGMPPPGKF